MPELPEVQTIVDDLNRKIKGDTITDFWSDAPKTLKDITVKRFKKEIVGRKILGAHRIGKNMFIDLSNGKTIYIHLKMTGHLLVKEQGTKNKEQKSYFNDKVNQYIHHIWKLRSRNVKRKTRNENTLHASRFTFHDKTLEFSDLRKFAKIVLLDTKDLKNYKDIKILGVDAMSKSFTFKRFEEILIKKSKTPIGIILMDQSLIAGIGNIYRSEILYDAGILPMRIAADLSEAERQKIYDSIGKILKLAIKLRGTSDSDYRDTTGAPGEFHKILKVYRKEKKKCRRCDTIIVRKKMGGRSVFFCSKCQN